MREAVLGRASALNSSILPLRVDGLEERAAADDRGLELTVERDLLLEVVRDVARAPAELDDVDELAAVSNIPSMSRMFRPLSMTWVRPLCARLARRARDAEPTVV